MLSMRAEFKSGPRWPLSTVPAPEKLKQENCHKFIQAGIHRKFQASSGFRALALFQNRKKASNPALLCYPCRDWLVDFCRLWHAPRVI